MRLSRLQPYDFRNYEQLQLELDPGVNLILGENAQGKTNLLELYPTCQPAAASAQRKRRNLSDSEQTLRT